ncbi:efflux RND transporter permease subunit [Gynuella sp.]|uniref:efflux RND transporter permease subunit n=1 Tax=Gynuella sp. TaxID=2969146 RepID=UPI003D152E05
MLRYLIQHPTVPNLLMLLALALGAFCLPQLQRETFPSIDGRILRVSVSYNGATPEEVESGICEPLEEATNGINNMKEKTCVAVEGGASLKLEMKEGADFARFKDDVQRQVDAVTTLPDDADDPVISVSGFTDIVASVAISGDVSRLDLFQLSQGMEQDLLRLNGVADVDMTGYINKEIRIEISPEKLRSLNLNISDLASIIGAQSKNLPLGTLETKDRQYSLRVADRRLTAADYENIIVLGNSDGGEVHLGDIATIRDGFSDRDNEVIFNDRPAIIMTINKAVSDDGLKVFDEIQAYLDSRQAALPKGIHLDVTLDVASIVSDRIRLVVQNGIQGLVLVLLVVWLFFSFRYAFWVAIGLPVSFAAGLFVMWMFGISLNLITLVALLISLGILMDDAIVIAESIATRITETKAKLGHELTHNELFDAVYEGVTRVGRGVLSSFATTALIFGGTLTIQGDIGQILKFLPIVLLIVLSISLIEAFLILPNHLAHGSAHVGTESNGFKGWFNRQFAALTVKVGRVAGFSVRRPYLVIALTFIMFFTSLGLFASGLVKFQGFPSAAGNNVDARVLLPADTTLSRTHEVVAEILASLDQTIAEIKQHNHENPVQNILIRYGVNQDSSISGDNMATVSVDLLDSDKRKTSTNDFMVYWRKHAPVIADASAFNIKEPSFGPAGQAISVELAGNNLDDLTLVAQKIKHTLAGYQGTINIQDDMTLGKSELKFSLKPGAYSMGLTSSNIASQLRTAFIGQTIDQIQSGGVTTDVVLKYSQDARDSLADIDNLVLLTNSDAVPIDQVMDYSWDQSWAVITRVNNRRVVTVGSDINNSLTSTGDITRKLKTELFPELRRQYPNLELKLRGESERVNESMTTLLMGFGIALFGVYFLLSMQFKNYFEPIMVMGVIPIALSGSLIGHWIMGQPFSMPSMMGYIALGGIVVNNSILLSEFVRLRLKEGMTLKEAAIQSAMDRFRAIIMTSATTLVGMAPMMLETSRQAVSLIPLVTSMLFGLLAASVLVLFMMPALYSIIADFRPELTQLEKD